MITVLVIDDQPIVLEGCRRVLEDAGIKTVIQARNLVSGYRLYYRCRPDVVVIDLGIRGPKLAGLSLIRRIIPTPDQIELAMYGNDVMDLTSSGLRSI